MYCDGDHSGDKETWRYSTDFTIYMKKALVRLLSKKQSMIETYVFVAEFVAMKIVMETLQGLRYKLRIMGIILSGTSLIYGDKMPVIHNTQRQESILRKNINSICYHTIRDLVAVG